MAINKDQFIEDLKGMSVLELNELVKAIEEEFGVSAAAPVAVAAAGAVEEEASTKSVILVSAGGTKMAVIKALRAINSELGLKEAKALADDGGAVKENIDAAEADTIKGQLEEAGATVELK